MRSAALSQYNQLGFVFLDLKTQSKKLDRKIQQDLQLLEKLVKKVFLARTEFSKSIEQITPELFNLKMSILKWSLTKNREVSVIQDEAGLIIEKMGKNSRLKRIAHNINQALVYNRMLTDFFKTEGILTDKNLASFLEEGTDYHAFITAIQLLPSQVRTILMNCTKTSLSIEFFSIAALLIDLNEVKASDLKLTQFSRFSAKVCIDYLAQVNYLMNMAKMDVFIQEKQQWEYKGVQGLIHAYAQSEPDYENVTVKEPNPEYKK